MAATRPFLPRWASRAGFLPRASSPRLKAMCRWTRGSPPPSRLVVDGGDLLVAQVVQGAVRLDPEVAQRHRLVAVDGEGDQEEGELPGQVAALHLLQILAGGVVLAEQAADGRAQQAQALVQAPPGHGGDAAR